MYKMMDDFDIFTNEINYSKSFYHDVLNKYVNDVPETPNGPNYKSGHKLKALDCLSKGEEIQCAFHLSEAMAPTLRTMMVYRDEQLKSNDDKFLKVTKYIKPVQNIIDSCPSTDEDDPFDFLSNDIDNTTTRLKYCKINGEPLHKSYLRFSKENNVDNFKKILEELPKEWTVIQLTSPYNPNENIKSLIDVRTEIPSILISLFTSNYDDIGPITIDVPANVCKEGEKPLFKELYSVLEDNYNTIDNAQYLNSKRLVQNYWSRREDIDLRMKSVINVMEKNWLSGWSGLLTGKLVDATLKNKVIKLVNDTIDDWGFIKLTQKQRILLYNLIENSVNMSSQQIKSGLRRILTEHGNTEELKSVLETCNTCDKEFTFTNELCLQCLSRCFEVIHHFSLVDGIKAFSKAAALVKDSDEFAGLKKARRHPVILIVDELLDTFPWETLPILNHHPISRIESIHMLYYLYKVHEKDIFEGYFDGKADVGRYVINPEKNLDRMEKRMSSFVQYWCQFAGHVGHAPPPADFLRYLAEADFYLYCGHGDGCHFANGGHGGAGIEGSCTRAVALLSGCGSSRLSLSAPRAPPAASHHHLHIAQSPLVVGMLWEVTDLEVDKVVSSLMALYLPSSAPVPWPQVGKANWTQGILDLNVESKGEFIPEHDILRAVCRARGSTKFVMIASSIVARGLPVRIRDSGKGRCL